MTDSIMSHISGSTLISSCLSHQIPFPLYLKCYASLNTVLILLDIPFYLSRALGCAALKDSFHSQWIKLSLVSWFSFYESFPLKTYLGLLREDQMTLLWVPIALCGFTFLIYFELIFGDVKKGSKFAFCLLISSCPSPIHWKTLLSLLRCLGGTFVRINRP